MPLANLNDIMEFHGKNLDPRLKATARAVLAACFENMSDFYLDRKLWLEWYVSSVQTARRFLAIYDAAKEFDRKQDATPGKLWNPKKHVIFFRSLSGRK